MKERGEMLRYVLVKKQEGNVIRCLLPIPIDTQWWFRQDCMSGRMVYSSM